MGLKRGLAYLLAVPFLIAGCKKDNPTEPSMNHAPVIERISIDHPEPLTDQRVNLECIAVDEDENDTLFYDWRSSNGRIENPYSRRVSWTSPSTPGTYQILVRVEDRERESAISNRQIDVASRFDTLYAIEDAFTMKHLPDFNSQGNEDFYQNFVEVYKCSSDGYSEEIYLKFELNHEIRPIKSIKLGLTGCFPGDNSRLNCCLYEIKGDWSEDALTYRNRPFYDPAPKKYFTIPSLDENSNFYLDITGIDMDYGIFIFPIDEEISNSFYSKEGAQKIGRPEYAPSLILEFE